MWVIVAPGGVTGLDYLWIGLAIALDVATWSGGAKSGVDRRSAARRVTTHLMIQAGLECR